jgi:hypothetical protein
MHTVLHWLSYPDPWLYVLAAYVFLLGAVGGWAICQVTHKQRGIEVDRPVTDNLPLPPAPVIVPDHVPAEWNTLEESGER